MWPFSRKKSGTTNSTTLAAGLEQLANAGVRVRSGISQNDLLDSLEGTMDSRVDWIELLCVLGSDVERGQFERISDDIWHFDAECIEDDGAYVEVVSRFVILAKGALPLTDIRDHVDVVAGEAWVEFNLDGKKEHWDLEVSDDWVDPEMYSRLQKLVTQRGAGKRFFIAGLGQDSLISFGDEQMRQTLSRLSGLKFEWE
jgi:hypothetical protein